MKVLILSCNTGGGHNAAAFALKESLEFHHHEAEVLDLMRLGRKHTSALVGGAYVNSSPFFRPDSALPISSESWYAVSRGNHRFIMRMRGLEMHSPIISFKIILMVSSQRTFIRRRH